MRKFLSLSFVVIVLFSCNKTPPPVTPPADSTGTTPPPPPPPVVAKKWIVSTVAGSGQGGSADGDSTQAQFLNAQGIAIDSHGNLVIGDQGNFSIRKISPAGHVTTYTNRSIMHSSFTFGNIYTVVVDKQDNIFTVEADFVRKIVSPDSSRFYGNLSVNYKDGWADTAAFDMIGNICIDRQGNLFLPDYDRTNKWHVRKITPAGFVSTLTLNDNTGFTSDLPITANLWYIYPIAVDSIGNLFVSANGGSMIKKIDINGNVSILAGTGGLGFKDGTGTAAQFNNILGLACDASGNVWVSDGNNSAIRRVTPAGAVTTIAGTGIMGFTNGDSSKAQFRYPFGITVDKSGVVYVMDNGNNSVRKIEYK